MLLEGAVDTTKSDGRVFLCVYCLVFDFSIFFPLLLFVLLLYRTLSHTHTLFRLISWWMVMIFVFVFPPLLYYIYILEMSMSHEQTNFVRWMWKKTKNVKKTKKNTVKSWCNETTNTSSFIFSLFSARVIVWLIYCTCLSENVVHLNLTRSHSQRVWWTVKNMEKIIFVFGLLPNAKSDVTHIVQVARVFKCLRQRYTQNRWGLF